MNLYSVLLESADYNGEPDAFLMVSADYPSNEQALKYYNESVIGMNPADYLEVDDFSNIWIHLVDNATDGKKIYDIKLQESMQ